MTVVHNVCNVFLLFVMSGLSGMCRALVGATLGKLPMHYSVYQFHDRIFFPELDNVHCSVILLYPKNILQRNSEQMTENDPVHSAMRDDGDVASPVVS